jgi:hypothetical protein
VKIGIDVAQSRHKLESRHALGPGFHTIAMSMAVMSRSEFRCIRQIVVIPDGHNGEMSTNPPEHLWASM